MDAHAAASMQDVERACAFTAQLEALRAELAALKPSALSKRARAMEGIDEGAMDVALDADDEDPKAALIKVMVAHASQTLATVASAAQIPQEELVLYSEPDFDELLRDLAIPLTTRVRLKKLHRELAAPPAEPSGPPPSLSANTAAPTVHQPATVSRDSAPPPPNPSPTPRTRAQDARPRRTATTTRIYNFSEP